MSPETTFEQNGTAVSYLEYYKTKYNETVSDVNQPALERRRTAGEQDITTDPRAAAHQATRCT